MAVPSSLHVLAFALAVAAATSAALPTSTLASSDTTPINCAQVTNSIAPCIPYLTNPGVALLTPGCCNGIRALNAASQSTSDRQAVCRCLKSAAASVPGINYDLASQLPTRCGINAAFTISPTTDCESVW
ncbi:hypothetical protein MLD38_032600 [Melastoma candidum]|uniref:Uncharacterized protein n=1 Tax=Melastoma candidum TaxID=119954 RepID=A0ACB9M650_9MYRT|nr:hypothetical protein MLD38_032600 [Melastoma candidum]